MKEKKINAYKGFDKDLKCRGFQYEVGKEYEMDGDIECCQSGFRACEYPLNVFECYNPSNSRFCQVEQSGEIETNGDKTSSSRIRVQCEIGIKGIVEASVKFILDKVNWKDRKATNTGNYSAATNTGYFSASTNTGNYSAATNTGNYSAATNTGIRSVATNTGIRSAATNTGDWSAATNTGYFSAATNTGYFSASTNTGVSSTATNTGVSSAATNTGDWSAATNTGYFSAATNTGNYSAATNTGYFSASTNTGDNSAATNTGNNSAATVNGKDSVAIVTGRDSKAKGSLGSWIVLTERREWNGETYPIKEVKAVKVDGERIKVDTFYKLIDGEFVEQK